MPATGDVAGGQCTARDPTMGLWQVNVPGKTFPGLRVLMWALPLAQEQGVGVMPSAVHALAVGEHLMDNTVSFCDVTCQNITAWAWRVLELSGAVNSGAGEAFWGHALG